jgi:riboflavin synthase
MFTGIIECKGIIKKIINTDGNRRLWISSPVTDQLKVDQSVAHNGICLTVEEVSNGLHTVTAVPETIQKTAIAGWQEGMTINIERCLEIGGRLDGHLVQGHVDSTGICIKKEDSGGSWLFRFSFPKEFASLIVEKGSICVNGISLTAFDVSDDAFTVTIIPYTYEHTTISDIIEGDVVNLEFDILGKYILRHARLMQKP